MTWKLIRRNVLAKPFRFLLTASAVTIGVMFTVGVFVFTDSVRETFGDLAGDVQSGFDLAVRSDIPFGERDDAPHVPVELETEIGAIDGVTATQPRMIQFGAEVLDADGERTGGRGFWVGFNWQDQTPTPLLYLSEGTEPSGPDEFVVDIDTLTDKEFVIGERYTVLLPTADPREMTLVGTFTFADPEENLLVGQNIVAFDTPTALDVLESGLGYDEITIVVDGGTDIDTVAAEVDTLLPDGFEVVTNEVLAQEQEDQFGEAISVFRTILLVFAFIILAVSAFVIYNVFTILIGQRIRELGLMRAIGATGRQVSGALLGEAFIVGIVATVLGTVLGIGLGWSLRWLLVQLEFGPEGNNLVLTPWTFVWGAGVGIGVTMASAVVPAVRARDVSPMAALRSDARLGRRVPAINVPLGAIVTVTAWVLVLLAVTLDGLDLGGTELPSWAVVMVLGAIAAGAHVFGVRRLHTGASRFALLGFGVVLLALALTLDLGTSRVLALLAVAAVTMFLGVASVSPLLARPAAEFLGRWPLSILVGVAGVVVTAMGVAGLVLTVVLAITSLIDLVTDPDLAALYGLVGSLLLALFVAGVAWVGVRSVDASFILGWRFWDVLVGIVVFVIGGIGVVSVLAGLAGLATGEVAGAAPLGVGVVALAIAWLVRRWLPLRMKSNARMARENAARSPRRTASAAAALMIGLALVTTASVVAESFKATFAAVLDESVTADWFITGDNFDPNGGFSPTLGDAIAQLDEIDTVVRFKFAQEAFQTAADLDVVDSSGTNLAASLDHIDPKFRDLDESLIGGDAIFVHEDFADDNGYAVGSDFRILFADGGEATVVVAGIFTDSAIYGNRVIDLELWDTHFPGSDDQFLSATTAEGVSEDQARAAIESITDGFPQITVDTADEFQDRQEGQIDSFLTVINVLLLVAVVIALLGIAITLALSVFERTRELGLVRAVGMTSRQMMRMVLFEGAIIAAFGGLLGVVLGLVFGAAAVSAIPDAFIDTLGISVVDLVQYVVVAAVAGIGAAIVPARRASRLDVLDAIAQE